MKNRRKREPELQPYKMGPFQRIPLGVKIPFVKWWTTGIVYYFMGFGSPFFRYGSIEQMFSIGAVIGLLNSYIVSRIIRDMTHLEDDENPYLTVKRRGPVGTLMHIGIALLLVLLVAFSYEGLNRLIIFLFDLERAKVYFPSDPIGFALFYLIYEWLWRKLVSAVKRTK